MELVATRKTFSANSAIGEWTNEGAHLCVTLEPPSAHWDQNTPLEVIKQAKAAALQIKDKYFPQGRRWAIPCGRYKIEMRWSPKHNRNVPHILNVPGFDYIEVHIGNWPKDTDGCTLVGKVAGVDCIFQSTVTFETVVLPLIEEKCKTEEVWLTVIESMAA